MTDRRSRRPPPALPAFRTARWTTARARDERGSMLIWTMALLSVVIVLAGLCLDVWRVVGAQRALSTTVDASAAAGANGIDEQAWRDSETLRLDADRARDLAADNLSRQPGSDRYTGVRIDTDAGSVTVQADLPVNFTLLRLVRPSFTVHATSTATPRRSP